MKRWTEPARELDVIADADVVVCGGGPAGCAAALAAARSGADTLLVEREGHCGGATVNQLVAVILSKNGRDFDAPWFEWYAELARLGGVGPLRFDHDGFKGCVDPERVKYAWDNLLSRAGVRLLHRAHAVGGMVEDGTVRGVVLETVRGRVAVSAGRVVDATGDGAVAAACGVGFEQGAGGKPWAMALTKVFRLGNVAWPPGWPDEAGVERLRAARTGAVERGELVHPVAATNERIVNYMKYRCWDLPPRRRELISVMSRVLETDPLDPFALSAAEREGREQARQCADFYIRHMPGFENAYLLDTGAHIGVRSSRRLAGTARVDDADVLEFRKHADGIARGSWDIDVWPVDSYVQPAVDTASEAAVRRRDALARGEYYDIRHGALIAGSVEGLLFAGRCVSASHLAESSLRIQQTCQATGAAAGFTAALSLSGGVACRDLPAGAVREAMERWRAEAPPPPEIVRNLPT